MLISASSSGLSVTSSAPIFSSKRSSLRVPNSGTIHGFCASSQARADLGGRCVVPLTDLANKIDKRLIGLSCLCREARNLAAEIDVGKLGARIDLAGQEALPERTERHKADAEFLQCRQDFGFGLAGPEGVLALQSRTGCTA